MHIAWVTYILPQDMAFLSQMVPYPLFKTKFNDPVLWYPGAQQLTVVVSVHIMVAFKVCSFQELLTGYGDDSDDENDICFG